MFLGERRTPGNERVLPPTCGTLCPGICLGPLAPTPGSAHVPLDTDRGLCPLGTLISSSHGAGVTIHRWCVMWLARQGNGGLGGAWGGRLRQEGRRDVWGSRGLPGGTCPGSASPLGPGIRELRDWLVQSYDFRPGLGGAGFTSRGWGGSRRVGPPAGGARAQPHHPPPPRRLSISQRTPRTSLSPERKKRRRLFELAKPKTNWQVLKDR